MESEWMDWWMHGRIDKWKSERMKGWMNEWMNEWLKEYGRVSNKHWRDYKNV